eukprot:TRINITY_DN719_c1_g3_i1.p1 TRINITY_DN719_c1_g3~~TRINITY_DN719_c1_g3_i1.p1  ORF type:complete len:437 (-),score=84.62 TRINITY_DN719_c1_g3_i1:244-1554(-)
MALNGGRKMGDICPLPTLLTGSRNPSPELKSVIQKVSEPANSPKLPDTYAASVRVRNTFIELTSQDLDRDLRGGVLSCPSSHIGRLRDAFSQYVVEEDDDNNRPAAAAAAAAATAAAAAAAATAAAAVAASQRPPSGSGAAGYGGAKVPDGSRRQCVSGPTGASVSCAPKKAGQRSAKYPGLDLAGPNTHPGTKIGVAAQPMPGYIAGAPGLDAGAVDVWSTQPTHCSYGPPVAGGTLAERTATNAYCQLPERSFASESRMGSGGSSLCGGPPPPTTAALVANAGLDTSAPGVQQSRQMRIPYVTEPQPAFQSAPPVAPTRPLVPRSTLYADPLSAVPASGGVSSRRKAALVSPQPRPASTSIRGASDALPSVGSVGHDAGKCKPCAFLHKKGCENGFSCQFCHLCDAGEKKKRRKEKIENRKADRKAKQQAHRQG